MSILRQLMVALLCFTLSFGWPLAYGDAGTGSTATPDETTSTAALYQQATTSYASCGMWHVSGICFFLVCVYVVCKIETSTRYSHMRPDVVVSTYHELDNHPWPQIGIPMGKMARQAASSLYSSIMGATTDSAGTRSEKNRDNKQVRFRDADAIGHPASDASFGDSKSTCKGAASPGDMYYNSFTDAYAWRNFVPVDLLYPSAWLPGLNEVSTGMGLTNTWGNVYPRTGWLVQHHDVKLAAVLSQRVADIITHPSNGHVFSSLASGDMVERDGNTVFDPVPTLEGQLIGGLWQVSAPTTAATNECYVFGENDSVMLSEHGDRKTTKTESYAYTLWRPYACCETKGAFLYAIVWGMW